MKNEIYKKLTKKQLIGKKVKSLTVLSNAMLVLPAGTIFTIIDKQGGFALKSEPCKCCGVRGYISKVLCSKVELIQESEAGDENV